MPVMDASASQIVDEVESTEDHPKAVSISAIDKSAVHRICSGQVVLTLATAVKELVENSIDAGATIVDVKLREYGSDSIEVGDNGIGVERKNFKGLTLKHHTSKLQDFSDLLGVETFGFRGEALSSLCALCDMTITTRHREADVGTKLELDHHGNITKETPLARQVGTSVVLQNLFYTLPVRHKEFQRNVKKEFVKMVQVLNSYCLISVGVKVTCTNQTGKGNRSTVVSTKGSTMRENISNIFGSKQLQSLLEFKQTTPGEDVCSEFGLKAARDGMFRIEGYVSKCDHGQGRSSSDRQFYFVNGRPFDSSKMTKVINEVYHQYNRHQYPFVAISISMEKDAVDVNVTPDKRQVFLQGEKTLLAILKASLVAMYEPTSSLYPVQMPAVFSHSSSTQSSKSSDIREPGGAAGRQTETAKESVSSTLSRLKRSFSSAFSKGDSGQGLGSHGSTHMELKQRKLDGCVRHCSPEAEDQRMVVREASKQEETTPADSGISTDSQSQSDADTVVLTGSIASPSSDSERGIRSLEALSVLSELSAPQEDLYSFLDSQKSGSSDDQHDTRNSEHQPCSASPVCCVSGRLSSDIGTVGTVIAHSSSSEVARDCSQEGWGAVANVGEAGDAKTWQGATAGSPIVPQYQHLDCQLTNDELDGKEDIPVCKVEKAISFSFTQLKTKLIAHQGRSGREEEGFCRMFRATINPADNQAAEEELAKEIKKEMFAKMEILGQFNLGFIITRLGEDLFIVDQHATDEKYNFERLQRDTVIQSQRLISPLCLELTASSETILIDNLEIFRKNGFEFVIDEEASTTQRVKLVSTPVSKNWNFGKEDIEEMVFMLTDSPGITCRPSRVRQMFASRACRKSIMIGTALNQAEMRKVVGHMGELDQPWNCPHGRPTMRHLINLKMVLG